jgi:glucose/arabinose dehydrogenase
VIRFSPAQIEAGSNFGAAELWGDGTRNEVGLRFDEQGRLWGVENGSDNLSRPDLGDIHEDNPGEEVNLFDQPGAFYGYPECWSEGALAAEFAQGPTTQWAYPSSSFDDAWCRDPNNVVAPVMVMQAHSAPLDIFFYPGGSFPAEFAGDALVTFHGSWNRTAETGYKVVRLPFGTDGMPVGTVEPLLEYAGTGDTGTGWPHRPVGLAATPDGKVLVTSDASNVVIAIGYDGS